MNSNYMDANYYYSYSSSPITNDDLFIYLISINDGINNMRREMKNMRREMKNMRREMANGFFALHEDMREIARILKSTSNTSSQR